MNILIIGGIVIAGIIVWKTGLLDSLLGKGHGGSGTPVTGAQWDRYVAANIADRNKGIEPGNKNSHLLVE